MTAPTGNPHEIVCGAIETVSAIYPMVEEFHQVYGHPVRLNTLTSSLLKLRGNLIGEESRREGIGALDEKNLTKFLDAIGDAAYVEVGSLVAMKGGLEHALAEPSDSTYMEICGILTDTLTPQSLSMVMMFSGWLGDGFILMAECEDRETVEEAIPILCSGLYISLQAKLCLCRALGIDLVELVKAIHESNMTKLWPADEQQLRDAIAISKYSEEDLCFRVCDSRPGLVGYRKSDGKILKSPDYKSVDLSRFVAKSAESSLWCAFVDRAL